MEKILQELMLIKDDKYKQFHKKILNADVEIFGCRTPDLKKLAKKYANTETGEKFLTNLPHKFYDENALHGFMLGYLKKDFDNVLEYVKKFIPYIDNWAVCDGTVANLKILSKNIDKAYKFATECVQSKKLWRVRFGVVIMLDYLVKTNYCENCVNLVLKIKLQDYYVKMAIAWFLSVVAVHNFNLVLKVFENKQLENWTHNKTIQKIKESFRITKEQKEIVEKLKIKQ